MIRPPRIGSSKERISLFCIRKMSANDRIREKNDCRGGTLCICSNLFIVRIVAAHLCATQYIIPCSTSSIMMQYKEKWTHVRTKKHGRCFIGQYVGIRSLCAVSPDAHGSLSRTRTRLRADPKRTSLLEPVVNVPTWPTYIMKVKYILYNACIRKW